MRIHRCLDVSTNQEGDFSSSTIEWIVEHFSSFLFVFRLRKAPSVCSNPHVGITAHYKGFPGNRLEVVICMYEASWEVVWASTFVGKWRYGVKGETFCWDEVTRTLWGHGEQVALELELPSELSSIIEEELDFYNSPYDKSLDTGCPSEGAVTLGAVVLFSRLQVLTRHPAVWSRYHHQQSQQLEVWVPESWRENVGRAPQHPQNCAKHNKAFLVTYLRTVSMMFSKAIEVPEVTKEWLLKDAHFLIPRVCGYVTIYGKRDVADGIIIKDLEMEHLSWSVLVCPWILKSRELFKAAEDSRFGSMRKTLHAKVGWLWRWGPWAKECGQPLAAGKGSYRRTVS